MHVRALVEGDALAFQIGDALDRRILGHQDRLALGCRGLDPGIDELGAGRLGEDRRGFAGGAEIDAARGQGLEQLRAAREFGPFDRNPQRR
jgi:hypothetical protein